MYIEEYYTSKYHLVCNVVLFLIYQPNYQVKVCDSSSHRFRESFIVFWIGFFKNCTVNGLVLLGGSLRCSILTMLLIHLFLSFKSFGSSSTKFLIVMVEYYYIHVYMHVYTCMYTCLWLKYTLAAEIYSSLWFSHVY